MIVTGERVAQFVANRLGFGLCPPYTAMGLERDGKIICGVLFNCFEGADTHVTIAGSGWTPGFVRAVGEYVFHQLACSRMTAITELPEIIRYVERMGGLVEGRLRNHFGPGRDGIICGILREEWPYVRYEPIQCA